MRYTLFTICALLVILSYAQSYETVYTSTGAEYEGYISEQIPGKSISVYAQKATLTFPMDKVTNLRKEDRPFKELSFSAQAFFANRNDTIYASLYSFNVEDSPVDNVFKSSLSTDDTLCVISFTPITYIIPWKDVTRVVKHVAEPTHPYGIKDIMLLKSGERYEGQITEQVLGQSITIRTFDGVNHKVQAKDVISIRAEKIAEDNLYNQLVLKDRVILKDGTTLTGFIVSRVMGEKINFLEETNHNERSIDLASIARYQKTWNHLYIPYQVPVDTVQSITVNKVEVDIAQILVNEDQTFMVDYVPVRLKVGRKISVLLHNYDLEDEFALYLLKDVKYKGDSTDIAGTKYPAFVTSSQPIKECTMMVRDDGDIFSSFKIQKAGKYALKIEDEKFIILEVEN